MIRCLFPKYMYMFLLLYAGNLRSKLINRFKNYRKESKRKLPNDSNNDSVDEPPNKVARVYP